MSDMLVKLYALPPLQPVLEEIRARGYQVRRAETWERRRVIELVEGFRPQWADEIRPGLSRHPVTVWVAARGAELVGFSACHCTRPNFFGPEGVLEEHRGQGLGRALLLAALWSMAEEGYGYAIIGAAGPTDFYGRYCGATVIADSEPGIYFSLRS